MGRYYEYVLQTEKRFTSSLYFNPLQLCFCDEILLTFYSDECELGKVQRDSHIVNL
jgi:hypothetical protein